MFLSWFRREELLWIVELIVFLLLLMAKLSFGEFGPTNGEFAWSFVCLNYLY